MASRSFWVVLAIALVLEALVISSWQNAKDLNEDLEDERERQRREGIESEQEIVPMKYKNAGFLVAFLFPAGLVGLAAFGRVDGFTIGSLVVAVVIETFLFMGWAESPQSEPALYFFFGTVFVVVLVFVTLLFHFLQREG